MRFRQPLRLAQAYRKSKTYTGRLDPKERRGLQLPEKKAWNRLPKSFSRMISNPGTYTVQHSVSLTLKKGVNSADEALAGAMDIIAEDVSDDPEIERA